VSLTSKIAYINLNNGEIKTDSIPTDLREQFLGGRGLDIYLLLSRFKPNTDPLGPDNIVTISAGLLAGTLTSTSSRTQIASKSPLTGYLGGANLGGFFAPELRRAGFDHLVITGKAKKPVFILINDGKISIHDASMVWGQTVPDTQEILRKEFEDDDIQTICIGPAGENQVRFASVMTRHQGASGRTGMGAVFGSKNLKAIAARGSKGIRIEHPAEAIEYDRKIVQDIISSEFGQKMQSLGVSSIDGSEDPFSEYAIGMDGCFGCQLHCRRRYVIKQGPYAGTYGQGPGYHLQQVWEAILGENQPEAILVANYLVNSYAIDAIETTNLIGWAMRLWDEGIITEEDADGIELRHGNAEAVNRMIHMIAHREGLGSVLAEGGIRAANKIGKGSAAYLREIKELADISDNRGLTPWQALGMDTSTRGSDHLRFLPAADPCRLSNTVLQEIINKPIAYNGKLPVDCRDYSGVPWLVFWNEMCGMALDILGICDFHSVLYSPESPSFEEFSKMIALNIGLEFSPAKIWEVAERAFTMEKLFNLREGYTSTKERLDDWYPYTNNLDSVENELLDKGKFELMLSQYYEIHGWDVLGVPKIETLKRLGLRTITNNSPRK
jgi:aldehyde:ferredoxin oxidoreductase